MAAQYQAPRETLTNGHPGHDQHGFRKCDFRKPSLFTISGLPAFNLLFGLRFHKHTRMVNCALPGDTIKNMSVIAKNRNLREALASKDFRWDAIMLSGGVNDLVDEAEDVLIPKASRNAAAIGGPADYLIDRLAEGILALETGPDRIRDFHVVDTRGTLKRSALGAQGGNADWQNEIHPNDDGEEKLAKRIEPGLERLLG
jgi:hypothetical protein